MQSTIVKHELAVGTFVVLALILSGWAFMKKTRDKGLLDTRSISFTVPHGSGLQKGAPVLMKGIEIGQIGDIRLTRDHKVRVTADISPRFADRITVGSEATVVEPPVIGSTKVEISPGESEFAVPNRAELETRQQGSLFARVDEIEVQVRGVIADVDSFVVAAQSTLTKVERVVDKIDAGEGLAGRLLNDPQLAEDVAEGLSEMRRVAQDVREGKGALALLLNNEGFADDLKETVADVRTVADELERGQGSLGRLLKDPELVEEATALVKDVRGSIAKLDDLNVEAKESVAKVQKLLDTTTAAVTKVDGLLGSAGDVTQELADTVRRVNSGTGTVAALLNDDSVYRETRSLLKELRESVEDLREQAPINSFIGVVFSAF